MPTFKLRSATEEDLVQRARTVLPGGMLANLYKPEEYLFVPERGDGGRVSATAKGDNKTMGMALAKVVEQAQ